MPSIRIPLTLKRSLALKGPQRCFARPASTAPSQQPPLTYGDPRLRAFLRVTFDVLYDWNIQTGAIYFGEQLDAHARAADRALSRAASRAGSSDCTPTTASGSVTRSGQSVSGLAPFRCEYRLRHGDGSFRIDRTIRESSWPTRPASPRT